MLNLELSSFFNWLLLSLLLILFLIDNKKAKLLKQKLDSAQRNYLYVHDKYKETCLDVENLKIEKDKTAEVYADNVNDLYRFAEFGKLSAGIFHDIVNPLTAIGLNLERIQDGQEKFNRYYIKEAIRSTNKMQEFIISIKKQINNQEKERYFNVNEEVEDCACLLKHKARKNDVRLKLKYSKRNYILGLNTKFNQVVLNLISNAIDSYKNIKRENNRLVIINIAKNKTRLKIIVQDFGEGIKVENKDKIFKPFYSTKKDQDKINKKDDNNGIGLHNSLYIIKKYFKGDLIVDSKYGQGTKMTLYLETKNKNNC
jgi:signal transduction histidine kinase